MYELKKSLGLWVVRLESNHKVMFSALSRKTAQMWLAVNEPIPTAAQRNATLGKNVWRARG